MYVAHTTPCPSALPFAMSRIPPSPPALDPPHPDTQALLHAVVILGIVGLLGKLHRWDDSAMFFDGSSLGASLPTLNWRCYELPAPTPKSTRSVSLSRTAGTSLFPASTNMYRSTP